MQPWALTALEDGMRASEDTYLRLALEDYHGHWELHCGVLRQKPDVSWEHSHIISELFLSLGRQLEGSEFAVRSQMGHVRRSSESYYIPDVYVVPRELVREGRRLQPKALEVYDAPVLLLVEVWSPSTGAYDVESKLPEYQRRGDLEIWRIHPYERTLTAWRRQTDGSYVESLHRGGTVQPAALPHVTIDLDALFG
jgi:Uma2 family endonuclease